MKTAGLDKMTQCLKKTFAQPFDYAQICRDLWAGDVNLEECFTPFRALFANPRPMLRSQFTDSDAQSTTDVKHKQE